MIGSVIAMEPTAFQAWLGGGNPSDSPAAAGAKLFQDLACISCHRNDAQAQAPQLAGLFGHPVKLQNGTSVVADEAYIRESIVNPQAKIVAGFPPIMPTFQGLVTEEQLLQLIAYIRSLNAQPGSAAPASPTMPQPATGPGK
jgi:cytochrome c oxidase subunit 2